MDFKYILFDLDGTLTDPKSGITRSVAYALDSFGIHVENLDDLCPFIGPPLKESFMVYYGLSEQDAARAVDKYRERFAPVGLFENQVYPGMPELLGRLKAAGKILLVATSKPAVYSVKILEHFGLAGYFDFVSGSELDGTREKKDEVIAYALAHAGVADLKSAVMVGDRKHDILGAKKNGLASVGVTYGYGGRAELAEAGADFIVDTVEAIGGVVLN